MDGIGNIGGPPVKPPVESPQWTEGQHALHRHDLQEWWEPTLAPHIYRQYQNQLHRYLQLAPAQPVLDVLDVGCAQATLALLLAERGHRVVAVDLREEFLAYARARHEYGQIEFVQANALELALEKRFDLVFANQIVEHLVYPERLFERLVAHLKPGGRLVMTTPNGLYLRNALPSFASLGDRTRVEHLQFTADGDGHFFAYRPEELRELACNAGLDGVSVETFETPWASGHMKARYLTARLPLEFIVAADRWTCRVPWLGPRLCHQLLVRGRKHA